MNLAERRVVEEFQTGSFLELRKQVEEAAGFPVEVEIDWESLAVPGESRLSTESWPQVYFEPLIAGPKAVARDEMGKEALKGQLMKIEIKNKKGCVYGDCWSSLEDGVLVLDHEPITNIGAVEERTKGLVSMLESAL